MLYRIYLSVAGDRIAEMLCKDLSVWGYACETVGEGTIQRIAARGEHELSATHFSQLVARVAAEGGAIYGFRMTLETDGIELPVDHETSRVRAAR